jgi:hypothetical protein
MGEGARGLGGLGGELRWAGVGVNRWLRAGGVQSGKRERVGA